VVKIVRRFRKDPCLLFSYIALVIVSFFAVFPLFWAISSSLRPAEELFARPPLLIPQTLDLKYYVQVLLYTAFPMYLRNTLIVALQSTLIAVVSASMAAYSFSRYNYRGREFISGTILLAYLFPPIVLIIPLFVFFRALNLVNTRFGLSLAHVTFTFPYAAWLLRGYFNAIPRDMEESAKIDGASNLKIFLNILLPLAAPAIVAAAIFTFIVSWNEFLFGLILTTSEETKPLSVGFYGRVHSGEMQEAWGGIMAWSNLMILPVLGFFLILEKRIVAGLTGGAIKG